ncbi:MAG: hypothetical protein GY870_06590 [archaeon]|nr:hypothetical protein [archaeon]
MKNSSLTDKEIEKAFEGTDFGNRPHIELLKNGVLKRCGGYYNGHTLTRIMQDLKLINKKGKVLQRGLLFLFDSFFNGKNEG